MTIGLFEPIFIEELFDYRIVNNGKRGRPLSLLETAGLVTNAPKGEAMDKLACASIIIFLNRLRLCPLEPLKQEPFLL